MVGLMSDLIDDLILWLTASVTSSGDSCRFVRMLISV